MVTKTQVMSTKKTDLLLASSKKFRSQRIVSKKVENAKNTPSKKQYTRTRGAPSRRDIIDSSSSSSDEDDDNEVKEDDPEESVVMEEDDDCSDEIDEDFTALWKTTRSPNSSGEKENWRRTRSQGRHIEETPSKKIARDLNAMCNVRTPKKNLSALRSQKEKENTTPRKNTRRASVSRKQPVFSESDADELSDELGEEYITTGIREIQSQKVRTPLQPIPPLRISRALLQRKVTPLLITKTPGGTHRVAKSLRTRQRIRKDSDNDSVEFEAPTPSTTVVTLKELASRLHLSKIPEKLPCREEESRLIEKFIREVIDPKKGESSAMYISGVPGTGKTATVRAVINSMQKNKKCPKFVYVEVNAMVFTKTVFVEVYNGIEQEYSISTKPSKIRATAARQHLNSIFKKEDPNRPPIVILIDELDSLCNRKQDVLYDIFEWTSLPQSRVTIIGIANTLDFPERMLCQRNASRLDKRRVVFQPYQHEQIQEIVRARLLGSKLIEPKAVELVSKKIASNTGDLRQALDSLCRAIQVAVDEKAEKLDVRHVITAQNRVLEPLKYRLVKGLRLHQFNLFRAVETMTREQEEVIFANAYKMYCSLCTEISLIEPASDSFAFGLLLQLSSIALVSLGKGDQGMMNRRIKLGMSTMEAERAVKMYTEKHKTTYSV
ncbi:unnamed protein product [Caenorhabditis sp. 36 PRJEB53466]|nr:unnamed protein product [Caenorhabditis sp. 36 PRJEB53466]